MLRKLLNVTTILFIMAITSPNLDSNNTDNKNKNKNKN